MDIPFLILAVASGLLLSQRIAPFVTGGLWAVAVTMVGWGPAHSDGVQTGSLGFWGPWLIVLVIGEALTFGLGLIRARRRAARRS